MAGMTVKESVRESHPFVSDLHLPIKRETDSLRISSDQVVSRVGLVCRAMSVTCDGYRSILLEEKAICAYSVELAAGLEECWCRWLTCGFGLGTGLTLTGA